MADMAAESESPRPYLAKIDELERKREKIEIELRAMEDRQNAADVLRAISGKEIRTLLSGLAEHLGEVDREALKEMISGMVERVELCPTTLTARLHYNFAAGDLVASPRGFEPRFIP